MPKPSRPRRNDAGLVATNFPLPQRWRIDHDYLDKLSPDERVWLAQFNTAFYGGDFRDHPEDWDKKQRSDVNRSKNAAKTDTYTLAAAGLWGPDGLDNVDELVNVLADAPRPFAPSPAYLETEDYKTARDDFRTHLTPHRAPADPEVTPSYTRAARRLQKVTPRNDEEELAASLAAVSALTTVLPAPEAAPKRKPPRAPRRLKRGARKGKGRVVGRVAKDSGKGSRRGRGPKPRPRGKNRRG